MRKVLLSMAGVIGSLLFNQVAHAEYLGLPNGRSADLTQMSDLSVEAGYVTGDFITESYDHFGVRVNYRVIPGLIVFGDFGKSEIEKFEDNPLGLGAFYQLQNLVSFADAAVKGSFHKGSFSRAGFFDADIRVLAVDLLLSGIEPLSDNGLTWYASAGVHRLTGDVAGVGTEPALGVGVTLPVGPGTVYFGLEHVDELSFGGGFRYNVF